MCDRGQVYRIAHSRVHNVPEITLNQPGRDERIDEYCRFTEVCDAAALHVCTQGSGIIVFNLNYRAFFKGLS